MRVGGLLSRPTGARRGPQRTISQAGPRKHGTRRPTLPINTHFGQSCKMSEYPVVKTLFQAQRGRQRRRSEHLLNSKATPYPLPVPNPPDCKMVDYCRHLAGQRALLKNHA
jgi:hypothetical protein